MATYREQVTALHLALGTGGDQDRQRPLKAVLGQ
jgi:hypothetical protein